MWLHVPTSVLSACAPEGEDLTSESDSLFQLLERSATWKEKSLRPAFWRRALKRAPWTTRLSGLTCSPSTAERGAAAWIASLEASPASRTHSPESDSESSTLETSGLPLPEWYSTLRQMSASSRTYRASWLTTGETYDPTYRPWATRLRRESSQRRRSARRIFGSASTSWPTARAHEAGDYQYDQGNHDSPRMTLDGAVKNWPTPTVDDSSNVTRQSGAQKSLTRDIQAWPAPNANEDSYRLQGDSQQSRSLTPAALLFRQALAIETAGANTSDSADLRLLRPVLNPSFVEALMGWPGGLTDYTSSETELYPWQQRMRSLLSLLGWE